MAKKNERTRWVIVDRERYDAARKLAFTVVGVFTGLSLLAALTAFIWSATLSDQRERKTERDNAAAAQTEKAEIQTDCVHETTFDKIAECVTEKNKTARDAQYAKANLRAQQDTASFAYGLFWWSALGFISSTLSVVALVGTFLAQQKLNRAQG